MPRITVQSASILRPTDSLKSWLDLAGCAFCSYFTLWCLKSWRRIHSYSYIYKILSLACFAFEEPFETVRACIGVLIVLYTERGDRSYCWRHFLGIWIDEAHARRGYIIVYHFFAAPHYPATGLWAIENCWLSCAGEDAYLYRTPTNIYTVHTTTKKKDE